MTAGSHELKVEYYENGGDAVAKVTIAVVLERKGIQGAMDPR